MLITQLPVQFFTIKLSTPYQDARFEYYKAVAGVTDRPVQSMRCMSEVDVNFGFVTGALFVEEHASSDVKPKV